MGLIRGLTKLRQQLVNKAKKVRKENNVEVTVGYNANYAVFVHENLEIIHKTGQAKFLEQPLRELLNDGQLAQTVIRAVKSGKTLAQALVLAGLLLQRESQKLAPVDTGNLRASAFTRLKQR